MMTVFFKYKSVLNIFAALVLALYIRLWFTKIEDSEPLQHTSKAEDVNMEYPKNKDHLTFVTYNLWCNYLAKSASNYVERFDGFARGVKDYDVVMVQEAFVLRIGPVEFSNCVGDLVEVMKLHGFKHHTSITASVPYIFGQSNGIVIFSKIPFNGKISVIFDDASIAERVNNKGIVYAQVTIKGKSMFILNTHTDAHSQKHRTAQTNQLKSIIKNYPPSSYIIAGGDFNINPNNPPLDGNEEEYENLVQTMSDVGLRPVFTAHNKTHLNGGCYDYVFISSNIMVQHKKVINLLTRKGEMVSDHYGLFMKVKLN